MSNAFDVKDVLIKGWEGFKANSLVFIVLTLISFLTYIFNTIVFSDLNVFLSSLLGALISSYFSLSFIKASFSALKGEKVSFNVLKNDIKPFFKFFLVYFILSLILLIAAMFFIIPLFLALAVFFPVQYIIVANPDLKIIDAFKKSWEITTKDFGTCLLFILVSTALGILGVFIIVGIFIVFPVFYIASAEAYKKLSGDDGNITVEAFASNETNN